MTGWWGLAVGHLHPTLDGMWACRECMAAHRQTCRECR